MSQEQLVEVSIARPSLPAMAAARESASFADIFDVVDPMSCEIAGAEYASARDQFKVLEEERMKMKRPIIDAGKAVDAFFKQALDYLEHTSTTLNRKISTYLDEQKRIQIEEEAKARELARREQERLAMEAAAREAAAREEAMRIQAQADEQAKAGNFAAAEQLAQQSELALLAGHQEARQTLAAAQSVVPVAVAAAVVPESVTRLQKWHAEVLDLQILVEAVCGGRRLKSWGYTGEERRKAWRAPIAFLQPDSMALDSTARDQQLSMHIPGVRAVGQTTVAKRRK
jgi:hypothetical protein